MKDSAPYSSYSRHWRTRSAPHGRTPLGARNLSNTDRCLEHVPKLGCRSTFPDARAGFLWFCDTLLLSFVP